MVDPILIGSYFAVNFVQSEKVLGGDSNSFPFILHRYRNTEDKGMYITDVKDKLSCIWFLPKINNTVQTRKRNKCRMSSNADVAPCKLR